MLITDKRGYEEMRKLLVLLTAVVLIFVVTACSITNNMSDTAGNTPTISSTITSYTSDGKEVNPVTLTTVSMFGGTDPNSSNYQAINKKLMDDYAYITIEDDSQSSDQDWKTKIAADFAVGNEPDVIQYFTDANASDVLAANKFVPIEEIRSVYPEYAENIFESALLSASNPDGVMRAVPTTSYWEGLFCNKDLFDEYGLALPTDWDKMIIAIETFYANGIVPIAVSLNNVPHYLVEFLILSAAGPEEYRKVPTSSPDEWIKGLEMVKTLRDLGAFPVDTDTIDNDFASELFKTKKAAMQIEGSWYVRGVTDQDNTVVITFPVIPEGKSETGAMVGGISTGFYITKKAWEDPDKRDAAVKFVMAHTSSESITSYWSGNGQATSKVEPLGYITPLGDSGLKYSSYATSISAPIDSRISQEAYNTLIAGIVDVSTGAKTAKELLDEVISINLK